MSEEKEEKAEERVVGRQKEKGNGISTEKKKQRVWGTGGNNGSAKGRELMHLIIGHSKNTTFLL